MSKSADRAKALKIIYETYVKKCKEAESKIFTCRRSDLLMLKESLAELNIQKDYAMQLWHKQRSLAKLENKKLK